MQQLFSLLDGLVTKATTLLEKITSIVGIVLHGITWLTEKTASGIWWWVTLPLRGVWWLICLPFRVVWGFIRFLGWCINLLFGIGLVAAIVVATFLALLAFTPLGWVAIPVVLCIMIAAGIVWLVMKLGYRKMGVDMKAVNRQKLMYSVFGLLVLIAVFGSGGTILIVLVPLACVAVPLGFFGMIAFWIMKNRPMKGGMTHA
jgi:hypothetical protein